jgi:exopolyphosphatase/pppGpp-phosphohydrolase
MTKSIPTPDPVRIAQQLDELRSILQDILKQGFFDDAKLAQTNPQRQRAIHESVTRAETILAILDFERP